MIIRIFKKDVCTRYIEVDEEVVLFFDDNEEHVVATGC